MFEKRARCPSRIAPARAKGIGARSVAAAALVGLALAVTGGARPSWGEPGDRGSRLPRILGRWATAGFGSIVELGSCDSGAAAGAVCGRITWLWDALDSAGRPRVDRENPSPGARTHPLVGTQVLLGFREISPGVWTGGSVYNPDDGRTYSGSITLQTKGALELEGCALRIFCQRQVWRRPEDLLEQAGMK